jgi:DnaK suppressor protein
MADRAFHIRRNFDNEMLAVLTARRREILNDVHTKLREAADEGPRGGDAADIAEADTQRDLDGALLELQSQMLGRIDRALARLRDGTYGRCVECAQRISTSRLRALPFAQRCSACQQARESSTMGPRAGVLASPFEQMVKRLADQH